MRYELELTVSGMDKAMMDRLYDFLDNNEYSYVGRENTYEEREAEEEVHMTFEEYIKQMSHKELQNFIYWVYQNGQEDHRNGCEDSPGDCSFFGGGILDRPAYEVLAKLNDYYGKDWRDE